MHLFYWLQFGLPADRMRHVLCICTSAGRRLRRVNDPVYAGTRGRCPGVRVRNRLFKSQPAGVNDFRGAGQADIRRRITRDLNIQCDRVTVCFPVAANLPIYTFIGAFDIFKTATDMRGYDCLFKARRFY